jgi:hypothetical protein
MVELAGSRPFRRVAGQVEVRLHPVEVELLRELCGDLADRLGDVGDREPVTGPLVRLFPDGYSDDPERADELRSLIQDDLRDGKIAAARGVVETLAELPPSRRTTLTDDQVEQWLTALNDLRLVLGTQLGVTEDDESDHAEDDEVTGATRDVYHLLSWLQTALVDVLLD